MARSTFTPGPWKLYSGKLRPVWDTRILEVQDVNGVAVVRWNGFDGCDQTKREVAANARLIATAPELLAALITARAWIVPTRHNHHAIKQIDRALKKAGGVRAAGRGRDESQR